MAIKSLFSDSGTGTLFLDRRQFYIEPQKVAELYTDITPFTTLLGQLEVKYVDDPLFKMFEHRPTFLKQEFIVTNATPGTVPNTDAGLSGLTIGSIVNLSSTLDTSYIGLELEVWNTTRTTKKGVVFISDVNGSTSITVKLLWAKGGATIVLAQNDVFIVVGNVRGEGSFAGDAWADELKVVFNSTQFFSVPVEVTGKLYKAALRGYSNELARLRDDKARQFKMQREKSFLYGASVIGTGMDGTTMTDGHRTDKNGGKNRTTMGIIPIIEQYGTATGDGQNQFTITEATYKYANFVDDAEKWFQYDADRGEKFAFCAPGAMSFWSKMDGSTGIAGRSGWQVKISENQRNSLGFNVRVLETPHGILHLVPTKALKYQYNKSMLIVDHTNLFHSIYEKPEFKNNVKTDNDYNGVKDVYKSDEGLGVTLQEAHQLINIA